MTRLVLLLNVPLMVLFFALWVGVPIWLVLKHPDTKPNPPAKRLRRGRGVLHLAAGRSGARRIQHGTG